MLFGLLPVRNADLLPGVYLPQFCGPSVEGNVMLIPTLQTMKAAALGNLAFPLVVEYDVCC
jgi:hypothetical protein